MGAIANVSAEYAFALMSGAADPAEKLDEFITSMNGAGIQKVIDEANMQIQDFLASK